MGKYTDDEIRADLEWDGLQVTDWFVVDGAALFQLRNGNLFCCADDDEEHAAAVVDYLTRLGQTRDRLPDHTQFDPDAT